LPQIPKLIVAFFVLLEEIDSFHSPGVKDEMLVVLKCISEVSYRLMKSALMREIACIDDNAASRKTLATSLIDNVVDKVKHYVRSKSSDSENMLDSKTDLNIDCYRQSRELQNLVG
jgi:hypothetical protein